VIERITLLFKKVAQQKTNSYTQSSKNMNKKAGEKQKRKSIQYTEATETKQTQSTLDENTKRFTILMENNEYKYSLQRVMKKEIALHVN